MTTTRLSVMDKMVQRACRLIEEKYFDPGLTAETICGELVTGSAFLEALFHKELGLSIDAFIMQVRINRARIELRKNPRFSAKALAGITGFSGERVFTDSFRAITGTDFDSYCESMTVASSREG